MEYRRTFQLTETHLFLDQPIVIDAALRSKLDAFAGRAPSKVWSWSSSPRGCSRSTTSRWSPASGKTQALEVARRDRQMSSRLAEACPRCGSRKTARILYGEPAPSPTLDDDIAAGHVVLGGCVVDEHPPQYRCGTCGGEFGGQAVTAVSTGSRSDTISATILPHGPRPGSWMVARLVLTGDAASRKSPPDPGLLIGLACDELRRQQANVRFLLTPAGFLRLELAPDQVLVGGWDTPAEDFNTVVGAATDGVSRLLSGPVLERANGVADYLVVGVDVAAPYDGGRPYGETALVIRASDGAVVGCTGKTYPNTKQQRHLIRNSDAGNHLIEVGDDRLGLLVCHDLVAFGKRSETNRRWRDRMEAAQALEDAMSGDPTVVLHLPHTVDSAQTFGPAWERLLDRHGGSTEAWASAIKYRVVGDGHRPDKPLSRELLEATSSSHDSVLDIVIGEHDVL